MTSLVKLQLINHFEVYDEQSSENISEFKEKNNKNELILRLLRCTGSVYLSFMYKYLEFVNNSHSFFCTYNCLLTE